MNLLVTGAWKEAQEFIPLIEKCGHNVNFLQFEQESIPCPYEWVEGVIANGLFLHHPIEQFENLKYIQLTSMGYDRVSLQHVEEKQIAIYNAKGVYSIPIAEYVIANILNIYKQIPFFQSNQKKCLWEKHRGLLELHQKKVCIVGCGNVGTECAKRFQAFGCVVTGIDISIREDIYYNNILLIEEFEHVLEESDIVIMTLPLTKETKHLMNNDKFEKMKEGAVLVNVARGEIIDTNALMRHANKLKAIILDVFEQEPLEKENALWKYDNVIITPHNSFVGENNCERLKDVILHNLQISI